MFFKVLKWDLKSQRKLFVLFFLYLLSIINVAIAYAIKVTWLIGITIGLHFMLGSLLLTIPLILLAINYYNDFYGKNAYTMHQLAVKTSTIYNAKILSGIIYTLVSFVLFVFGSLTVNSIFNGFRSTKDVIGAIGASFKGFAMLPQYIENVNAFTFWVFVLFFIIFSLFATQIYYSFVVTLGKSKLLRRFGKGGIVISFLVSYIGVQIISFLTILYFPLTLLIVESTSGSMLKVSFVTNSFVNIIDNYTTSFYGIFPIAPFIIFIILVIIGYKYVSYSLDKKKSIE